MRLSSGKLSTLTPIEVEVIQDCSVLNNYQVYLYHNYLTDDAHLLGDKDLLFNNMSLLKVGIKYQFQPNNNF